MADLSQYLDFNVTLDYSGTTPVLKLTDVSAYPTGVPAGITGVATVRQPDGISIAGNFTTPDVAYVGSALTVASLELRAASDGTPQNGSYAVTYTVKNTSYQDTSLTKTFSLNYSTPNVAMVKSFDVFTPQLSVIDISTYNVPSLLIQSVLRSWIGNIIGLTTVTSTLAQFDLAYGNNYYDAAYSVNLTSIVSWKIATAPFVTVKCKVSGTNIFDAYAPQSLASILSSIQAYKDKLDSNAFCDKSKQNNYLVANALYQQLAERGRTGVFTELSDYVLDIYKALNNDVTPVYTHTLQVIPAYSWGISTSSSVTWTAISGKPSSVPIQFTAGDVGYVAVGGNSYTDSRLANVKMVVYRNDIRQRGSNPNNGNSYYEKPLNSSTITFFPSLGVGDFIDMLTIPI